jgi:hypothetical protein
MAAMNLAAALLFLLLPPARAEFRSTEDMQYWAPTFLHAPDFGPYGARLELNARMRGDMRLLSQLLVRPSVGRKLTDYLSADLGYAWVRNESSAVMTQEHRAWEQATLSAQALGAKLSLRNRLEQRWLPGTRGVSWRARFMGRAEKPLAGGPWYAVFSNEIFAAFASADGYDLTGAEQNRAFVGLGRLGRGKRRVEAGYQNWWLRRPAQRDKIFHVVVLTTHW